MAKDNEVKNEEELKKKLEEREAIEDRISDILKQREQATLKSLKYQDEIAKAHGKELDIHQAKLDQLNALAKLENEMATRKSEMSDAEIAAKTEEISLIKELMGNMNEYGATIDEQKAKLDQLTNAMSKKGAKAGQEFFGGIASKMGLASDMSNTLVGRMKEFSVQMKDPDFAKNFTKKMGEIFTWQNLVYSSTMAIVQATMAMVMAADKATASFAKQTGAGRAMTGEIVAVGTQYRNLGLDQETAGKAAQALWSQFPRFQNLAAGQRKELVKLSASLNKLGVDMADTSAMLTHFTKGLKMSVEDAANMTREIALQGKALGMSAADYAKGFNEANKSLAVYGAKAPKIFQKIAAAAKSAGVETGKLLGIAGKFDTFSDAAETTGKLNAILGTQMSAMEMLQGTEEERIETMIKTMQMNGMAFKDMDRFTQKAVAQTLGINDMAEAQRILGMDLSSYKKMNREAEASAKAQEEMEKRMKDAMDVAQKFKMMLGELAVAVAPIVEMFAEYAQTVLDLVHRHKEWLAPLTAVWVSIAVVSKFFGLFMPILKIFGLMGAPLAAKAMKKMGKAGSKNAKGVQKFAVSMGSLGASMFVAALAFSMVVLSLAVLVYTLVMLAETGWVAVGVLFGLAGAVIGVAFAIMMLANPMAAIGAAILTGIIWTLVALAAAVALMSFGMAAAIEQIIALVDRNSDIIAMSNTLIEFAWILKTVGAGIQSIAFGLMFLAIAAPGVKVLEMLMNAITPFMQAVATIAESFSNIFTALTNVNFGEVAKTFSTLKSGLEDIYEVIDNETDRGIQITHTLENLALITTGQSSGTTMQSGFQGIVKALTGMKTQIPIKIEIKGDDVKKLFEKGQLELMLNGTG